MKQGGFYFEKSKMAFRVACRRHDDDGHSSNGFGNGKREWYR